MDIRARKVGESMRVISRSRLARFAASRKADADQARRDLDAWHDLARGARWSNFGDLRQTFGSADVVGDCVVFDVGNNCYRLIGRVRYTTGIVYVLAVMDHKEYDKQSWIADCGCYQPAPRKPTGKPPAAPKRPKKRKG